MGSEWCYYHQPNNIHEKLIEINIRKKQRQQIKKQLFDEKIANINIYSAANLETSRGPQNLLYGPHFVWATLI